MGIFAWIVLGAVVGIVARLLVPRDVPAGWLARICLGIGGGVAGGWIATRIRGTGPTGMPNPNFSGLVGAVVGAALLVAIHRLITLRQERAAARRRASVHRIEDYRDIA